MPFLNNALNKLPPVAFQQGMCSARTRIDGGKTEAAGSFLKRTEKLPPDALAALRWFDQTSSGPWRKIPVTRDGIGLESGDSAKNAILICHNADWKAATIGIRLKIASCIAGTFGAIIRGPLSFKPTPKLRQGVGMCSKVLDFHAASHLRCVLTSVLPRFGRVAGIVAPAVSGVNR